MAPAHCSSWPGAVPDTALVPKCGGAVALRDAISPQLLRHRPADGKKGPHPAIVGDTGIYTGKRGTFRLWDHDRRVTLQFSE
jgi:hypothetical protein